MILKKDRMTFSSRTHNSCSFHAMQETLEIVQPVTRQRVGARCAITPLNTLSRGAVFSQAWVLGGLFYKSNTPTAGFCVSFIHKRQRLVLFLTCLLDTDWLVININ